MPNVELSGKEQLSPFRKIALGTWQTAYDPSIYGTLSVRVDQVVHYIEKFRERYGLKLTITHIVAKALAEGLKACPEANGLLRWNKIHLRKNIDISLLVVMESDGKV